MPPRAVEERYELDRRLGHGGMATVYLAHDRKLERPVAVKVLADNLAGDDQFRLRFVREARLAAQLDHPNVVQVYDVEEDADRPFIVMELVEGETLAELVERRSEGLTVREAASLLCQASEGLGHAHSRGLVHRDVKPQNLLIRRSDCCVKVVDFGIARAAEDTSLTQTGLVIGTERYMAPEQTSGGRLTPATDVYGCGVVATEMLPPSRRRPLQPVIDRCLAHDPAARFPDGRELAAALARVEAGGLTAPTARLHETGSPTQTAPLSRTEPRDAPAVDGHGGPPADTAAPSRAAEAPPRGRPRAGGGFRRLLPIALVAAVLGAGALAFSLLSDDDGGTADQGSVQPGADSAPGVPTGDGTQGRVPPLPRSDDPAEQARQLADWLRARAR